MLFEQKVTGVPKP